MKQSWTEADIIKRLKWHVDSNKHPFQFANVFMFGWECDYLAISTGGETREFEIKISRADFLVDAKKHKHSTGNGANYFYYVVPSGLLTPSEIDKRYGLIYMTDEGTLLTMRRPRQIHSNKFDQWKEVASKMFWRWQRMWMQHLKENKITRDEYRDGLVLDLEGNEIDYQTSLNPSPNE